MMVFVSNNSGTSIYNTTTNEGCLPTLDSCLFPLTGQNYDRKLTLMEQVKYTSNKIELRTQLSSG